MRAASNSAFPDMPALFGGAYQNRRVLVTGHTGFKGSWLTHWLQAMGAQVSGLALPAETIPSHHALMNAPLHELEMDIRDACNVRRAIQQFQPEIVFHLAAQALVRRSYSEPAATFDVNVMGLVNVLEAVRCTDSVRVVVNVTTDKCYQQPLSTDLAANAVGVATNAFVESDALGGHDPYSASKACAEIVTQSYRASFMTPNDTSRSKVAIATARAGNVIGGGDWSTDRLVPDLVRAASENRAVPIRNPGAIRPWQHVLEPLSGYLLLGQRLLGAQGNVGNFAAAWNFGPAADGHLSVANVIDGFSSHWSAVRPVADTALNPHEAEALRLDCSKARQQLCWKPVWNSTTMLERTALWYRAWYERGEIRTAADLSAYVSDATSAKLCWVRS